MKITRHIKIMELINSKDVDTQEEIADYLNKIGVHVTQATVSRDIRALNLIKVIGNSGNYKYATSSPKDTFLLNKLVNIFEKTVLHVENVNNFVIIKTISGSAPIAAEAIDLLGFEGIKGTIAGNNEIFIITKDTEKAEIVVHQLKDLLNP